MVNQQLYSMTVDMTCMTLLYQHMKHYTYYISTAQLRPPPRVRLAPLQRWAAVTVAGNAGDREAHRHCSSSPHRSDP